MSTNAMSCVVAVELGAVRVLLTGDLPAREEAEMAARVGDLATTLLVAPHHGSRSSSSPELLAAAAPQWVLFQAGYQNRFGHPAADVIERYRLLDAHMRRTDFDGAVQWRLKADGTVEVEAWRTEHRRYWHNQPATPARWAGDSESEAPAMPREP